MAPPITEAGDLAAIEPWISGLMANLAPGKRMMLARRIGMMLRRVNAARVMANVDPDGAAFAPRRPRQERPAKHARKGRVPIRQRGKQGRMFKRIELARNMVVISGADEVALTFRPRVLKTATIHHFGEVAPVDPRIANSIRVRYAARRLLGFGAGDSAAIIEQVMKALEEA